MRTFDVYHHPARDYQAVKQGFGWPAFLFCAIWAFFKRMWGVGLAVLAVLFVLKIIESVIVLENNFWAAVILLLVNFGVLVLMGFKGNDWRRATLLRKGYKKVATLEAVYPQAAIDSVAEPESPDNSAAEQNAKARAT